MQSSFDSFPMTQLSQANLVADLCFWNGRCWSELSQGHASSTDARMAATAAEPWSHELSVILTRCSVEIPRPWSSALPYFPVSTAVKVFGQDGVGIGRVFRFSSPRQGRVRRSSCGHCLAPAFSLSVFGIPCMVGAEAANHTV
jgi:hypothetical protein